VPSAVNTVDQIVGYYVKSDKQFHGFLRNSNGGFISFDPQGSSATHAVAINALGAIVGNFIDVNGNHHGFARQKNGTIVSFDAPGSTGTFAGSVNSVGEIVGSYDPTSQAQAQTVERTGAEVCFGQPVTGFLRQKDGTIVSFDVPGSLVTGPAGIDRLGNIAGSYLDGNCTSHGFLREP
jgi:hypothetical protein